MPDWESFVRSRLAAAELKPDREQRIVRELACQLGESYKDALSSGLTAPEAEALARQQVPDRDRLIAEIRRADSSEAR